MIKCSLLHFTFYEGRLEKKALHSLPSKSAAKKIQSKFLALSAFEQSVFSENGTNY